MNWGTVFLLTLGGAFAFEGLGWALAPEAMKRAYAQAIAMLDNRRLSVFGLLTFGLGLVLIVAGIRLASG